MHATAEAVIELLAGAHAERWSFFVVERAARHVILPGFLELNAFAYDVRDVDPG